MTVRVIWLAACLCVLLTSLRASAAAVGFEIIHVAVPRDAPLDVAVWYPTPALATPHTLGPFLQTVALAAPIAEARLPLVVMSHGTGEWNGAQYDTALALAGAGFVVAAPTHTGDNSRDQSRATRLDDRPRQMHRVIDYMLKVWRGHRQLDAGHVGVFGFSSGAVTALILAGGLPDLRKMGAHCADHPDFFDCKLIAVHLEPMPTGPVFERDARIRAVVVAAPALGFAFAPDGLAAVRVPVQIWQAGDDQFLPSPFYAQAVRDALPSPPEYHVVNGADHLDFLAPCTEAMKTAASDLCRERGSFDRNAFHHEFNARIVEFFSRTIRLPKPRSTGSGPYG